MLTGSAIDVSSSLAGIHLIKPLKEVGTLTARGSSSSRIRFRWLVSALIVVAVVVLFAFGQQYRTYTFSGLVYAVEPFGGIRPVENVLVQLYMADQPWGESGPTEYIASTTTDGAGIFRFSFTGDWMVYFHVKATPPTGHSALGCEGGPWGIAAADNVVELPNWPLDLEGIEFRVSCEGDLCEKPEGVTAEIVLSLESGDYEIEVNEAGESTITMEGFGYTSSPGDPMLPFRIYDVIVPPDVEWETVELELAPQVSAVPGEHLIGPAAPFVTRVGDSFEITWGEAKEIADGRNIDVYESNVPFPSKPVDIISQGQMRKWRFLRLAFTPIQYNPVTGQLTLVGSVEVRLRFQRAGGEEYRTDPLLGDTLMDEEASVRFFNFDSAQEWYEYAPDQEAAGGGAGAEYPGYAIVTTNAIAKGSNKMLAAFESFKKSQGRTVHIVTEDEYGSGTGGTAEKIRQWLKDNYVSLGIKWVLLIGNPDPDDPDSPTDAGGDVPMKMCWPRRHEYCKYYGGEKAPTDHFFADLTGDWDLDKDGYYGEHVSFSNPTSPDPQIHEDTFSVRWTGKIEVDTEDWYGFATHSDDGIRVWVDGQSVIDHWVAHLPTKFTSNVKLTQGKHDIKIEYYQKSDEAVARLYWSPPVSTGQMASYMIVPNSRFSHLEGGAYVSGLKAEYFDNEALAGPPTVTRVDPTIDFYWGTGDYDKAGKGVDFAQEVYVGRIPVYNNDYAALDGILGKIITYESSYSIPEWRKRVLLPMPKNSEKGFGWDVGEWIKENALIPFNLGFYRLYSEKYGLNPEASSCDAGKVEAEWKKGYGVVTWVTHGTAKTAVSVFDKDQCSKLDDDRPSFVFLGACSNGQPEVSWNLQYELLKRGAVNTVGATSYTAGTFTTDKGAISKYRGMLQDFACFYTGYLAGLKKSSGEALYTVKNDNTNVLSSRRKNSMVLNIYGDPDCSLLRPYEYAGEPVDVIPVLDVSGSMSEYASKAKKDAKIDVLKTATKHLTDLLDADGNHQLGLVTFSTTASSPATMKLEAFNASAKAKAHSAIKNTSAGGLTSIGAGLKQAVDEFKARGKSGNRRVVLLVTDGMENTGPMIKDVQSKLIAEGISVHALGLGYSYGIDAKKLMTLANDTGGSYRVEDAALKYHKYFIEMLCNAADKTQVVKDPVFELNYGQTEQISVTIGVDEEEAIFTAYWLDVDSAIELTVCSPIGEVYDSGVPEFVGASRYALYKIDLTGLPIDRRAGEWVMDLRGVADQPVQVSASAFARPGPTLTVELDPRLLQTGDAVLVAARIENGAHPSRGLTLSATTTVPRLDSAT